jgi:hypothetical protein
MVQDVVVIASGVLKGVSQDWHSVKSTLLVNAFGKNANVGREPSGINGGGAERVSHNLSQNSWRAVIRRVPIALRRVAPYHANISGDFLLC